MRRILKWTGLIACAFLTLTIVLSRWWSFAWSGPYHWGFVQWGAVGLGPHGLVDDFSWRFGTNIQTYPLWWWFDYDGPRGAANECLKTPLWLPLLMIAVPTFLAWRRDRRFPAGHCQKCGYDLAGNTSGVCPECGAAIVREPAPPVDGTNAQTPPKS